MIAAVLVCGVLETGCGSDSNTILPGGALDFALDVLVSKPDGPPGAIAVVQRGDAIEIHTAGVADITTQAEIRGDDYMRLASVAKAFSGAAAVAAVAQGAMSLDDAVSRWRPDLPSVWGPVTLGQLLNHTSGIPDFSGTQSFRNAVEASLLQAPPPVELLSYLCTDPATFTGCAGPSFTPGSQYRYSNSDNIMVGLMIEAAAGEPYEQALTRYVYSPLRLTDTSLPRGAAMPSPLFHGYDVSEEGSEDVSEVFAAGWAWASGGVVSTPNDATRFVRGYVAGDTTNAATHAQQFTFIEGGSSEPPGPGANSAGLAVFRYETRCGTVYGHTGNTAGYTQFIAASEDGRRSITVSINSQITPGRNEERFAELRRIYELGVCAALR